METDRTIPAGYVWLFAVSAFFLVRLLPDAAMVRRPLLEPHLSASGLTFTGLSLLVFLLASVITSPPERLENLLANQETPVVANPGYEFFYTFSSFSNRAMIPVDQTAHRQALIRVATTCTATILAHLAVVAGMVWIGLRHFDNIHTGVAAATLYLLDFYTSQFTSQVDHVAPAMLLVWAVAAYRRPAIAGVLLGLAAGMIYYPLFLLPLWFGFYWRRGAIRFAFGIILAMAVLVTSLALNSPDLDSFTTHVEQMFGWRNPFQVQSSLSGFWHYYEPAYRIPVLAAFVALCGGLAIWPAQKNLGTLLLFRGCWPRSSGWPITAGLHGVVSAVADPDGLPTEPEDRMACRPCSRWRRKG